MNRWISPKFIARVGRVVIGLAILVGTLLTLFIPVRIVVPASGTVQGETVLVSSSLHAPIKQILVRTGAKVSAGDPVLVLDTTSIQEQLMSLQTKIETGWISIPLPRDEQIKTKMESLEEGMKNSVVRSPASGVVELFYFLEVGRTVMEGRPLFRVYRSDSITVDLSVPEDGFMTYAAGSLVSIRDVFGKEYAGKVLFRGEAIFNSSKSYESYVNCTAAFEDTATPPIGSKVSVEAVHYKGPLIGLVTTPKPTGSVFRFGW